MQRIAFLDYLRIFAFASVFIGHLYFDDIILGLQQVHAHFLIDLITPFVQGGIAGVIVFFLISGYIINEVLIKERPSQFFIRRIFRIYPLYIVAVLLELYTNHLQGIPNISVAQSMARILLIGDFLHIPLGLGAVEWTLRAEMLFYVFMTVCKATHLLAYKKLFFAILGVGSILSVLTYPIFKMIGFVALPFLFLGVMVNLYQHKNISTLALLLALFTLLTAPLYFVLLYGDSDAKLNYTSMAIGVSLFFILYLLQGKIKLTATAYFISQLTYPVYLFHNFLVEFLEKSLSMLFFPQVSAFIIFMVFVIMMHYLIEKPFNKLGHKYK